MRVDHVGCRMRRWNYSVYRFLDRHAIAHLVGETYCRRRSDLGPSDWRGRLGFGPWRRNTKLAALGLVGHFGRLLPGCLCLGDVGFILMSERRDGGRCGHDVGDSLNIAHWLGGNVLLVANHF